MVHVPKNCATLCIKGLQIDNFARFIFIVYRKEPPLEKVSYAYVSYKMTFFLKYEYLWLFIIHIFYYLCNK